MKVKEVSIILTELLKRTHFIFDCKLVILNFCYFTLKGFLAFAIVSLPPILALTSHPHTP